MSADETKPLMSAKQVKEIDAQAIINRDAESGTPPPPYPSVVRDDAQDNEDDIQLDTQKPIEPQREAAHLNTSLQSLMNLLKGNIGTGILAIPFAIQNSGLYVGTLGLAFMAVICIHCMHLLVSASHYLCKKVGKAKLDYGEVAAETFRLRFGDKAAGIAKMVIDTFLCITQFGFCIVYILFMAENIKLIVDSHFPHLEWAIQSYQALILIILIPYALLRQLKYLAPFSLAANFLTLFGLIVILQHCFRNLKAIDSVPASKSAKGLALYFGTVIYAFEGIGVVLPIENKMKNPQKFAGWNGVLNTGMVIVSVFYIATGFYGYLCFGDSIKPSITLNLDTADPLYLSVQAIFIISIFMTFALQFYVPILLLWPFFYNRLPAGNLRDYGEYGLRVVCVLFCFAMAAVIPHLDLMISLVGAVSSSTLALIFPPVLEIMTRYPDELGRYRWRLVKDICLIVFGLCGFIAGTSVSLYEIIQSF